MRCEYIESVKYLYLIKMYSKKVCCKYHRVLPINCIVLDFSLQILVSLFQVVYSFSNKIL